VLYAIEFGVAPLEGVELIFALASAQTRYSYRNLVNYTVFTDEACRSLGRAMLGKRFS